MTTIHVEDVTDEVTETRLDHRWRVSALYGAIAVTLTGLVSIAPRIWHQGPAPSRAHVAFDSVIGNWFWWDGQWYLHIAQFGYSYQPGHQSSVAFFPVYPLAIRLFGVLFPGGQPVAAVAITLACGAGTMVLFHRWTAQHLGSRAANCSVVCLAVYPYAWFLYGAAYSDALFLFTAMAAFLLLEDDRPVAAALAGAVATAARPTGIIVVVGLVAVMLDRRRARPSRTEASARDFAVIASVAGVVTWCAWLAYRFGSPFAFIETEGAKGWDRAPGIDTWLKAPLVQGIGRDGPGPWLAHIVQAVLCVAFICAIPAVWRRFGGGYGIYTAVTVFAPALSTDDFMGTGRYLLAAFPIFAIVGGGLVDHPLGRTTYTILSAVALVLGATLFATGHYLS